MRRVLLISLALVLALVGWSTVCAEDGFYVIPTMKKNYAPVPKTGKTDSYTPKDDGDLEKGVAWPTPRFIDNLNGTVTDKLTGLIWTKNADCFGLKTWGQALSDAATVADGTCDLTDGSKAGDWRLPNIRELQSLVAWDVRNYPYLPADHPFINVGNLYWSSTTYASYSEGAWAIYFDAANRVAVGKGNLANGWCVRGGK